MLSNTAVASAATVWLVTARPILTLVMVTVSESMVVQATPSAECSLSRVLPVRVSRTHFWVAVAAIVEVVVAPLVRRRWNLFWVLLGLIIVKAFTSLAPRPSPPGSRIITPAFTLLPSPPEMELTRAVMLPSPLSVL